METIQQRTETSQTQQPLTQRELDALIIDEFAASERRLIERVADLEADRDAYQLLSKQSIHALRDVVVERDRLRRRLAQLLDELRQYRTSTASDRVQRAA